MSAFAMFAFAILATKELQRWLFEDQYYLVAIDGPGYFCADHIKCDPCMVRRSGGKAQYDHQVVAAVLAHPITKQVVPLAVEPIMRSDGQAKKTIRTETSYVAEILLNKSQGDGRVNFLQHHECDVSWWCADRGEK